MRLLTRYVTGEFVKPLLLSSAAFGGLVLISEFFRELNYYLEHKTPFSAVFIYLLFNLPWWIVQVLPVAVLLAVLFSLGGLSRTGEITAIKAAGVNLWKILRVLFVCGIVIGAGELALRESVIPYTVRMAERIQKEQIRLDRKPPRTDYHDLAIALPNDARMTIGSVDTVEGVARQIAVDYYGDGFELERQIIAEKAEWHPPYWVLKNGVVRTFVDTGDKWTETEFHAKPFTFPFSPDDFIIENIRPEQMSSGEFIDYIRQLQTLGNPATRERIQFQMRWSAAFSYMIVMMIGVPFALGMGGRHGKMVSFTFALIFAFLYWGVQAVGQSLGENEVVSPVAAAWLGNAVFGVVGIMILSKVRR